MEQADRERLKSNLSKEPVVNCGFLEYLNTYEVARSGLSGSSCAAVFKVGDDKWGAICSRSEEETKALSGLFDGMLNLSICPAFDWSVHAALEGRKPNYVLHCTLVHLPDEVDVPEASAEPVPIGVEQAEAIYSNYKRADFMDIGYIRERLQEGPAIGVFREGRLVGCALTHDDFSMGMLTVLPEYRRQGIAMDMTLALIKEMRRRGKKPIAHIEKGNSMSMPLVKKLGFVDICDIMFLG